MRKTVDGLVLRENTFGENDRLLTVLTAEYGKMFFIAKGTRSVQSKNLALCRVFTYGNFEYYEKNGTKWLAGGSVNDSFFGLNSDIEGFALAAYILDIAGEISGEDVPDAELLSAVLNTLYAVSVKLRPLGQIKGAFEFFSAAHSGFCPDLSVCERCGKKNDGTFYLDVAGGTLLCSECLNRGIPVKRVSEGRDFDPYAEKTLLIPLTPGVSAAAEYCVHAPVKRLFSFSLASGDDIDAFSEAGEKYLQFHLERGFETLDFYHSICEPVKDFSKQ